jgi:hypothetical protein
LSFPPGKGKIREIPFEEKFDVRVEKPMLRQADRQTGRHTLE